MSIAALSPATADAAPKTHTVAPGQSLWKIAHRYHVSVGSLSQANGIKEGDSLKAGQVLTIPDGKGTKQPTPTRVARKSSRPEPKAESSKVPTNPKPAAGASDEELPPLSKLTPAAEGEPDAEKPAPPAPKAARAPERTPSNAASKSAPHSRLAKKGSSGDGRAQAQPGKSSRASQASSHGKSIKTLSSASKPARKTPPAAPPKKSAPKPGPDADEGD